MTLKDIAQASGVDVSTVSRSLNGSYGIHRETRERVLAVVARLSYHPTRIARGLATGRSHTIGLILSDIRNNIELASVIHPPLQPARTFPNAAYSA